MGSPGFPQAAAAGVCTAVDATFGGSSRLWSITDFGSCSGRTEGSWLEFASVVGGFALGEAGAGSGAVLGTEEAVLGVGSCQGQPVVSECAVLQVRLGGVQTPTRWFLKMRRGSGEAMVEGKMEKRHQALVTEWVSFLSA